MPNLDKLFGTITEAYGAAGAIGLLFCAVIVFLFRRLSASEASRIKEGKECSAGKETAYETRLKETERSTAALEKNAQTSLALISASNARTEAFHEMVKGFAVLVETQKADRAALKEGQDRIERRQEQMIMILQQLPSRIGAS